MPPFTFRCPDTGFRVQGWTSDDDESEGDGVAYEVVTCPACGRLHLVYPENSPDDRRKQPIAGALKGRRGLRGDV